MSKTKVQNSVSEPFEIKVQALSKSMTNERLAQHMSILQAFGYTDLASLGKLTLGPQGGASAILLQKSGVLFPSPQGPYSNRQQMLAGYARTSNQPNIFTPLAGPSLVLDSKNLIIKPGDGRGDPKNLVSLNVAYWFATQIVLQDDTTVVLASEVKSLVIIAETLTIGQRVTISWDHPYKEPANNQEKPKTPDGYDQATGPGSFNGRPGLAGYSGNKGNDGDPAPELEIWFLQSSGFPALDLRGQDGFVGGRGGDGGDGGPGQKGCNSELKTGGLGGCKQKPGSGGHGGSGGRAGDGGPGGSGGTGGELAVFAPQNILNTWLQAGITISVDGGNGGAGGEAGRPGEGGLGGAKGEQGHPVACNSNSHVPGQKGNTGPSGLRGPDGKKGDLQPNSIQFTPIDPSDFYVELTKPAIISVSPTAAFVGDTVSVNGLRFAVGDQVFIEGYDGNINIPCSTTFVASSLLTFIVPRISGGYALFEVVQTDGTRSSNKGTLTVRPRIEGIIPTSRLKPGHFYFLKGTGLGRNGSIWMNGESIGSFTSVDNDTVKFKARRASNVVYREEGEPAKLKVVNSEGAGSGNPHHSPEIDVILDTFRLLACGDSVMWGGGLPEDLKFYSLVANYIKSKMEGASVVKTIKAHHGAKIGRGDNTVKPEMHGEISSRWPTILQQVDTLGMMPDANEVDMVLIDGGANDLPITGVMLESDSNKLEAVKKALVADTHQYCYDDMKFMLQKVLGKFPSATIIVTGYYHIVSEESDLNFLQRMILTIWEDISDFPLWGNTMEATRNKVIALSNLWVKESNKKLEAAVNDINNNLPNEPRVFFVNPDTLPVHAAHAPNSLLWQPDSLGGPTDPMWKGGREQLRDANEARIRSEDNYYMVKRNSSYHPNPAGAQRYFDKIKPVLDLAAKKTRIAIRCHSGRYLCAEGGGNGILSANRVNLANWETFEMVDLGNNKIALKSVTGFYVCAENGGGSTVIVNRYRIGSWETFTLEKISSGVAFKTSSNQYLSVPNGTDTVSANATQISATEIFQIV